MNAVCKYCKKEIECKNESEKSIVKRFGVHVISHFDCVKKEILLSQFPKRKGDYNKVPLVKRPVG